MMDDLFDLLFTVIVAFLLLFLVQAILPGSIEDRNEDVERTVYGLEDTISLLALKRMNYYQGQEIDFTLLKVDLETIQEVGGSAQTELQTELIMREKIKEWKNE